MELQEIDALERACSIYTKEHDWEGIAKVGNVLNTIQRDTGKYKEAVKQMRSLIQRVDKENISIESRIQCYENLVRSLVFVGEWSEGKKIGTGALELAKENNLIKTRGTCHFALAECYRYGELFSEAICEYNHSSKIAQQIANRDCFLWAQLGLADTYFMKGAIDEAVKSLMPVQDIVNAYQANYPLESRHWKLSIACIDFIKKSQKNNELHASASAYDALGISWPQEYIEALIKTPQSPQPKRF